MRILAIDDQLLVLLPLQKRLQSQGYHVNISSDLRSAKLQFMMQEPDLIIVDLNIGGESGLDMIQHVRKNTPKVKIVVMSGITNSDTILKCYALGVHDFLKKPLSLNEVTARINSLMGVTLPLRLPHNADNPLILNHCVGVVIPCYNEAERIHRNEFYDFVAQHAGYKLCFVNDGSTDNTLEVLQELAKRYPKHVTVYNCVKNGGKAEAVRQGMLHLAQYRELDYIGFLDADLSTNLGDFDALVATLESENYQVVVGSRMQRMGANITKDGARKIISKAVNLIIRKILQMPFNDTQCGAKIFRKGLVKPLFGKPFISKWIFDVEIFLRMRKLYGAQRATNAICEQPLKRWVHADGSKLSMKDSFKIVFQLGHIFIHYKNKSKSNLKVA